MKHHHTRNLYEFETMLLYAMTEGHQQYSIHVLATVLSGIWAGEKGHIGKCPLLTVKEDPEFKIDGTCCSFYRKSKHQINLVPTYCNVVTLVHEITHALYPKLNHGPKFRHHYFRLLDEYLGIRRSWLDEHYKVWTQYKERIKK